MEVTSKVFKALRILCSLSRMAGAIHAAPFAGAAAGAGALAAETELAEDTVQNEGDTRHVAAVLKQRQHEKQHQHLGHEAQHRADACRIEHVISDKSFKAIQNHMK